MRQAILICGPQASGKTRLAEELAKAKGGKRLVLYSPENGRAIIRALDVSHDTVILDDCALGILSALELWMMLSSPKITRRQYGSQREEVIAGPTLWIITTTYLPEWLPDDLLRRMEVFVLTGKAGGK